MRQIGRNDICWCGSQIKYKNCHMQFDERIKEFRLKGAKVPTHMMIKNKEEIEGEVEFSEILGEENNYLVLQFKTDIDWLNAQSIFGLETVKSYSTRKDGKVAKNMERKGVARVLDGAKVLNELLGDKI